jgi:hypothetical protein
MAMDRIAKRSALPAQFGVAEVPFDAFVAASIASQPPKSSLKDYAAQRFRLKARRFGEPHQFRNLQSAASLVVQPHVRPVAFDENGAGVKMGAKRSPLLVGGKTG